MKPYIFSLNIAVYLIVLIPFAGFSQLSISGKITDKTDGQPLMGAHIIIDESYLSTTSDVQGNYTFKKVSPGEHILKVSYMGYKSESFEITLESSKTIDFAMEYSSILSDEVIVSALRADKKSPTTYSTINREQIEKSNTGQDLPYILQMTPSVVTTSDAGAGVGYTGIRIRGTDITGINVTMNGVPINDAESQNVYFVDLPDLASSVDNIQIQRGVGTSSNGAAAFGASINIQTTRLQAIPYAEISSSAGTFNTFKNTARFGSGLLGGKWAVDGRLSAISSDGYIDRGWSDLKSFHLSGGYHSERTIVKAIITSGKEETYQAWNGVSKEQLKVDRRYNPSGEMYNAEGILEGFYDNQTDNYQQDYYQLHLAQKLTDDLNLSSALFYTKGKGYYENYRNKRAYSEYGFDDVIIGPNTISESNTVDQKWLDNDFYGINLAFNYSKQKLKLTLGGGYNYYDGDHYGYVIWAEHASNGFIDKPWYENTGKKSDFNVFGKASYPLNAKLNLYADLQYRGITYDISGTHDDLRDLTQSHNFNFLNPKGGVFYELNDQNSFYGSVAVANREPNRSVYRDADPGQEITYESLTDYEFGYKFTNHFMKLESNVYYMAYKNQFVLTGKINNVGDPILNNVPESYRLGLEIVAGFKILKNLTWDLNATLSQNKIQNFTEYVDNWNYWDDPENETYQYQKNLGETDISFSPGVIAGSNITYKPIKGLAASFLTRYVGKQYIDNTSNDERSLDPYMVNDLKFVYTIKTDFIKEIGLMLSLNNIFGEEYESNAWVYRYVYGGEENSMFGFYPQAIFYLTGGVSLKF
jgi:iron complex outermembrane receptor protein